MTNPLQDGFQGESGREIEFSQFIQLLSSKKETSIDVICDRLSIEIRNRDSKRRMLCAEFLLSEASHCIPAQIRDWALYELLFAATYCADFEVTKLLLDAKLDINAYDVRNDNTPLSFALEADDSVFIGYLLASGADPFAKLSNQDTVLGWYLHSASQETIRVMLGQCPDICSKLIAEPEIFDACIQVGKPENITLLLEFFQEQGIQVSINPEVLIALANEEDGENLKGFMDIGLSINVFDETTIKAFFYAIKSGNKEMVEIFLSKGMLTSSDYKGYQPIHYAIKYKQLDIMKLLFRHGVNINVIYGDKEHPLIMAAKTRNVDVFDFIMDMSPRLDDVDLEELIESMTLNMKIHNPQILDMYDALNEDPNPQKGIDESPVNSIANLIDGKSDEECFTLIKELLLKEFVPSQTVKAIISQRNLDINTLIDKDGSLLHFAAKNNVHYAIDVLLELGSDINLLNESCERTPLLVAIAQRCKDAALTLIEAGADCELADEFQITPMLEAVETLGMEHRVVVALLRAGADDHGLIFISEQ